MQIANDESAKIIEALSISYPKLAATLELVRVNFGVSLAYKQEKLNQFTEFLMEHQDVFNKPKIEAGEFQDGLVIFLESYFKLRTDEKLKLAQNIFLDFVDRPTLDMPFYPLERYDDTLEKISHTGVQFLGFINTEVPKLKLEYVEERMRQNNNTTETKSMEEWVATYCKSKPINFFVEQHIRKLATAQMKSFTGVEGLAEKARVQDEVRKPFSLAQSELEQLGLARSHENNLGWSSGEHFFGLTHYGEMFISIIKPEDVYKYID